MYRAVALAALEAGVALDDEHACAALAREHAIAVDGGVTTIDGRDVSAEIRGPDVTAAVSTVVGASRRYGRCSWRSSARGCAEHGAGVVEGRDIGTVVFPAAPAEGVPHRERRRAGAPAPARRSGVGARGARSTTCGPRWRGATRSTVAASRRRCAPADDAIVVDTTDRDDRRRRGRARRAGPRGGDRLMLFYRLVRPFVTGIPRLLWRVRIVGLEHVPATGGFVLAPSHRSMMDIPFAATVTTRRIRFMGKASLFEVPVLGTLFTWLGGFPVARDGTDRKAVRESVAMLAGGRGAVRLPRGHAPARPEDPAAAARRRVPRAPVRRADHPGRDRGRRGDPARARAIRSRGSAGSRS